MKLRDYQRSDKNEVLELWWESWHSSSGFEHPKPIEEWVDRWDNIVDTHRIVVAEEDCIIAFAAIEPEKQTLSQIFVHPTKKRRGVGKILMNWVFEQLPNGFNLKTLVENHESRMFYESFGLKPGSRSVNDFNSKDVIEYKAERKKWRQCD